MKYKQEQTTQLTSAVGFALVPNEILEDLVLCRACALSESDTLLEETDTLVEETGLGVFLSTCTDGLLSVSFSSLFNAGFDVGFVAGSGLDEPLAGNLSLTMSCFAS